MGIVYSFDVNTGCCHGGPPSDNVTCSEYRAESKSKGQVTCESSPPTTVSVNLQIIMLPHSSCHVTFSDPMGRPQPGMQQWWMMECDPHVPLMNGQQETMRCRDQPPLIHHHHLQMVHSHHWRQCLPWSHWRRQLYQTGQPEQLPTAGHGAVQLEPHTVAGRGCLDGIGTGHLHWNHLGQVTQTSQMSVHCLWYWTTALASGQPLVDTIPMWSVQYWKLRFLLTSAQAPLRMQQPLGHPDSWCQIATGCARDEPNSMSGHLDAHMESYTQLDNYKLINIFINNAFTCLSVDTTV